MRAAGQRRDDLLSARAKTECFARKCPFGVKKRFAFQRGDMQPAPQRASTKGQLHYSTLFAGVHCSVLFCSARISSQLRRRVRVSFLLSNANCTARVSLAAQIVAALIELTSSPCLTRPHSVRRASEPKLAGDRVARPA